MDTNTRPAAAIAIPCHYAYADNPHPPHFEIVFDGRNLTLGDPCEMALPVCAEHLAIAVDQAIEIWGASSVEVSWR